MKKYIQLVALFVATTSIFAQSQDFQTNYTFSECEGAFPTILNYNITDLAVNSANNDSYSGDIKNGFYYKNSFDLINMMHGGKILFGDKITSYVQDVLDNLLVKSEKENMNYCRVYVIKTNKFQCFSYFDGSIFVSMALLSNIGSEAQLAFALAREVAAIEQENDVNLWKENDAYIKNSFTFTSAEEFFKTLNVNAQSKTFNQDTEGLHMISDAGYNYEEADYYLLQKRYSHHPFDNQTFDKRFFNRDKFTIPAEYFKVDKEISDESNSDSELKYTISSVSDDDYEPMPNLDDRRNELTNYDTIEANNVTFLLDEAKFKYMQTKARFENQFLHLTNKNFIAGIYETYMLMDDYPNNVYLKECLAMGMYGLSKFKLNNSSAETMYFNDEDGDPALVGSITALSMFYDECSEKELNIIATKLMLEQKDRAKFKPYITDLMKDLIMDLEFDYTDFAVNATVNIDTIKGQDGKDSLVLLDNKFEEISKAKFQKLSKIEKISYSKKKETYEAKLKEFKKLKSKKASKSSAKKSGKYYLQALKVELQDTSVLNEYKRISRLDEYRYFDEWYATLSVKQKAQYQKNKAKRNKAIQSNEINSVIVMNPKYYLVGAAKTERNTLQFAKMEAYKERLYNSAMSNLKLNNITTLDFATYSSSRFSDITSLNQAFMLAEWQDEIDLSFEYRMVPFSKSRVNDIFEATGFKNVLFFGVNTSGDKAYKFMRVTDNNGYNDMYKFTNGTRKGNPTKDNKFITKTFSQID